MDRLLVLAKVERVIKQSLDNLEVVKLSNAQKAKAITVELSFALDDILLEKEEVLENVRDCE